MRERKLVSKVPLFSIRRVCKPSIAPGEVVLENLNALWSAPTRFIDAFPESVQYIQETDDAVGCRMDKGTAIQGNETILRER